MAAYQYFSHEGIYIKFLVSIINLTLLSTPAETYGSDENVAGPNITMASGRVKLFSYQVEKKRHINWQEI